MPQPTAREKMQSSRDRSYFLPTIFVVPALDLAVEKLLVEQQLGLIEQQISQNTAAKINWQTLWFNDLGESIKIETIRELITHLSYGLDPGKGQNIVLLHAHQLTIAAQQAFLKSLEEPPTFTRVILSTSQPQMLLPTIHSRSNLVYADISNVEQMAKTEHPALQIFLTMLNEPQNYTYGQIIDFVGQQKDREETKSLVNKALDSLGKEKPTAQNTKIRQTLLLTYQYLSQNVSIKLAFENCLFNLKNE